MGNKYSLLYDCESMVSFTLNKRILPAIVIGGYNVMKMYTIDTYEEDDYLNRFIITKSKNPMYIVSKRKVKVFENMSDSNLKHTLKKYGTISKVSNYYIFSIAENPRIIIYKSFPNEKVFDYRENLLFKFYINDVYNIYVL